MTVSYSGLTFERLGHASVRIETDEGLVAYIDPWDEVLADAPGDGDVVFVTHDDFDHYDPDGIDAVASPDATVASYEAIDTADLDHETIELPLEGETTVDDIAVQTVPAFNDPDGEHIDGDGNPYHAEGEVVGLVLTIDGTTVFFPSDTDYLTHHEDIDAEVFIPPIGGHYTMDRKEAASFAKRLNPSLVLPVHYDTFGAIETNASAFAREVADDTTRVELF